MPTELIIELITIPDDLEQKNSATTQLLPSEVVLDLSSINHENNPLLSPLFAREPVYIVNPPVNSTGDIYHIAAYLFLCQRLNWCMPTVLLTHDEENSAAQADRAYRFMSTIGLDLYCDKLSFTTESKHPRPRLSSLRKITLQNRQNTVDQKISTALLAQAMRRWGNQKVIQHLRKGFLNLEYADKNELKRIISWALNCCHRIQTSANGKPIVIINHRISDDTNAHLSLATKTLQLTKERLELNGFYVHLLIVGPDINEQSAEHFLFYRNDVKHYTHAFEPKVVEYQGYEKLQHIILLDQMLKMANVFGMVGGTSGTLDIAAFLGWNVHNIHQFKAAAGGNTDLLDVQGYRILLQSQFLSIGHSLATEEGMVAMQCWIDTGRRQFPSIQQTLKTSGDHVERDPFKYITIGNAGSLPSTAVQQRSKSDYKVAKYNNSSERDLNALSSIEELSKKMEVWYRTDNKKSEAALAPGLLSRLSITATKPKRYSQDDNVNKTSLNQRKELIIGRNGSFSI